MRTYIAVLAGGLVWGMFGLAFGAHPEPATAKRLSVTLVQAYRSCPSPDPPGSTPDTTYLGISGCTSPTPLDSVCAFATGGSGVAKARVVEGPVHDIRLVAKVKGLNLACEDAHLKGFVLVRVTLDNCDAGPCTLQDIMLDIGACTVTGGVCHVNSSINESSLVPILGTGGRTGIEIIGCGVRRDTVDGPVTTFSCGLFVP